MTAEEIRTDEAIERLMSECLTSLMPMEADFIRECLFRRMTHAEFSAKWDLPPLPLTKFKANALANLKHVLATKGIHSMGDLL